MSLCLHTQIVRDPDSGPKRTAAMWLVRNTADTRKKRDPRSSWLWSTYPAAWECLVFYFSSKPLYCMYVLDRLTTCKFQRAQMGFVRHYVAELALY